MKVVVIPQRPIHGILPKNKWIDSKIALDLNKNEILYCMQFGNVYTESGELIDTRNIQYVLSQSSKETVTVQVPDEHEEIVDDTPKHEDPYYNLEVKSYTKVDDHIILEIKMNSNSKLEGNLYGLFSIISGPRPTSFEYNSNGTWVKFNNKFANFNSIENNDTFEFRFVPKNEYEFSYRIMIKEANEVLAKLEDKLNPSAL